MKVLVVGAGPAGLALACLLAQCGESVEVYEARGEIPDVVEESYPIGVNARSLHTCAAIDLALADAVRASGTLVDSWDIYAGYRRVASLTSGVVYGSSRAKINRLLYDHCLSLPNVTVHFGLRLESMDFTAKTLTFSSQSPHG